MLKSFHVWNIYPDLEPDLFTPWWCGITDCRQQKIMKNFGVGKELLYYILETSLSGIGLASLAHRALRSFNSGEQ